MSTARHLTIFAICREREIAPLAARAFSLSRHIGDGTVRPLAIFIARSASGQLVGYLNRCPHQGVWLNVGDGRFLDEGDTHLRCGRHKARFDIESGTCIEGPCRGAQLEPVAVVALDGEICLCGVDLVPDDLDAGAFDETMEITIQSG